MIVSEPMGYLLFNERMIESYLHARKFLKPGGKPCDHGGGHVHAIYTFHVVHSFQDAFEIIHVVITILLVKFSFH